jgi:hypothetical protein
MTKPEEYRIVNDRVITEEKYQSEQASAALADAAEKWGVITIPAAAAAFIWVVFFTDINGWFWKLIAGAIAALMVYTFLIPAIILLFLLAVILLMAKMGAFG